MKPTVKTGAVLLLSFLLLITQSGCTYVLWTNGNLEAYRVPAQNPNLRLYQSRQWNDVLVVYQEMSERNDAIHTREFWLNKNQKRIEELHTPSFVSKKSVRDLSPISVYSSMPGQTGEGTYAVCETNALAFTLYTAGRETGCYKLPVYNDGWGRIEKTALTPVAVSVDLTIAGGFVGLMYLYGLAGESVPNGY